MCFDLRFRFAGEDPTGALDLFEGEFFTREFDHSFVDVFCSIRVIAPGFRSGYRQGPKAKSSRSDMRGICFFSVLLFFFHSSSWSQQRVESVSDLSSIFKSHQIQSVAELIPHLPPEFLNNVIVTFWSESIQESSCEWPRILLFSDSGQMVLAFNGSRKQQGFEALEVREFDPKKRRFHYREIVFPKDLQIREEYLKVQYGTDRERLSRELEVLKARGNRQGTNPELCQACHAPEVDSGRKDDLRPNQKPYPFWPGQLGEVDDTIRLPRWRTFLDWLRYQDRETISKDCVDKFAQSWRLNSRYRHLQFLEILDQKELQNERLITNNTFYTNISFLLNYQRIRRLIEERPDSQSIKFQVLKAWVCLREDVRSWYVRPRLRLDRLMNLVSQKTGHSRKFLQTHSTDLVANDGHGADNFVNALLQEDRDFEHLVSVQRPSDPRSIYRDLVHDPHKPLLRAHPPLELKVPEELICASEELPAASSPGPHLKPREKKHNYENR